MNLEKMFALTKKGARDIKKATLSSFILNICYMGLVMIAMYFAYNTINKIEISIWKYAIIILIALIITYFVLDKDYVNTFDTTYEEAKNLRIEIADILKNMPISYFSKHNISDLSQTIMQDVLDIEHAVSHAIPKCFAYASFSILMAVILILSNYKLGLAAILPIAFGFFLMYISKNNQKNWTKKYYLEMRKHSEIFQEVIELQREIKSYDLIDKKNEEVLETLKESEKLRLKAEAYQAIPIILSVSIMKFAIGFTALVAARLLSENLIDVIFVIGYILASVRLVDAVGAIEENFAEMLYLDSRVKRINELRQTEVQKGTEVDLKKFDIVLKNVEFSYKEDVKVIDKVNFEAEQGKVTAIVGPSGCGKSTILRLVSRLYDYDRGQILIDGNDIKDISTDSLYDKISMVFQDVVLFNASVMENIRIGNPSASDQEVIEASKMANCHEFIEMLPEGYATEIGENGSNLSGGERQRISIARAFLKKAPILLLDEISSSIDVENEMKIQESLNKLTREKTVIIVSHRLKSIERVDKIIVMDNGSIDSQGSHDELMEKSSLYRSLINKSKMTEEFTY